MEQNIPSTLSLLTEIASLTKHIWRYDSNAARNLMQVFEMTANLEKNDPQNWSRIWYLIVYSDFYTNVGYILLSSGDIEGAEECLNKSFDPSLGDLEESFFAMWNARGYRNYAEESREGIPPGRHYPMRLALKLAVAGRYKTAIRYVIQVIKWDRQKQHRPLYCFALSKILKLAGRTRAASRMDRILGSSKIIQWLIYLTDSHW